MIDGEKELCSPEAFMEIQSLSSSRPGTVWEIRTEICFQTLEFPQLYDPSQEKSILSRFSFNPGALTLTFTRHTTLLRATDINISHSPYQAAASLYRKPSHSWNVSVMIYRRRSLFFMVFLSLVPQHSSSSSPSPLCLSARKMSDVIRSEIDMKSTVAFRKRTKDDKVFKLWKKNGNLFPPPFLAQCLLPLISSTKREQRKGKPSHHSTRYHNKRHQTSHK